MCPTSADAEQCGFRGDGIEFREYAVYAHVADREIEAAAERIGAAIAKLLD